MRKMILDVGCGSRPRGDINVDLFYGKSPHTIGLIKHLDIKCSAEFLPFRNETFEIVYSSHTLEHLQNPYGALKEFKRVGKNIIYLQIPNSAHVMSQHSKHIYAWDKETFTNLLKQIFQDVRVHSNIYEAINSISSSFLKQYGYILLRKIFGNQLTAICKK